MKAVTCPQCGALLEDISIEKNMARCDYCRAKIMIRSLDEKPEELEVTLVTRAEGGKEDMESYVRGGLKFTKTKFTVNDSARLAIYQKRRENRMRRFGFWVLIFGIIGFIVLGIYLNSNL